MGEAAAGQGVGGHATDSQQQRVCLKLCQKAHLMLCCGMGQHALANGSGPTLVYSWLLGVPGWHEGRRQACVELVQERHASAMRKS